MSEQLPLIEPPAYEIRTVQDFLKVPADRRRVCLGEFGTFLKIHDDLMTVLNGDEPPVVEFAYFKWIDDGAREVSVVLHVDEPATDSPRPAPTPEQPS